jgi:hypothetical protein
MDHRRAGLEMTARIMGAVAHIVDDEPSEVVIEAMAAAMLATLVAAEVSVEDQREVLRRYADRIMGFAAAL